MSRSGRKNALQDAAAQRYDAWMDGSVPHRAFATLRLSPAEIGLGVVLTVGATAGWFAALPRIAVLWEKILSFWIPRLWPGTTVSLFERTMVGAWRIPVPYFKINAGPIDGWTWVAIAVGSVLLFVLSYWIPSDTQLPYVYLARAFAVIQWSALIYTALVHRPFPHDASEYCASMLLFGMIFIGVIPGIMGFTFYIFDVTLFQKIVLPALIMAHLTVFIPLQYLVHACILRVSLLFLPILYFALGPLVDVIVLISFYSWGMSWRSSRRPVESQLLAASRISAIASRYED